MINTIIDKCLDALKGETGDQISYVRGLLEALRAMQPLNITSQSTGSYQNKGTPGTSNSGLTVSGVTVTPIVDDESNLMDAEARLKLDGVKKLAGDV